MDGIVALGGGGRWGPGWFLGQPLPIWGIHFVQIPTSLTAQVDSSIGGKTGVNTPLQEYGGYLCSTRWGSD